MLYRIMLSFYGLIFATMAWATQAQAVSLGKVDVASHLGEPFYAEVPLTLDEGEVITSMFVEMASPADYRILEVYRDQALNNIRTDVRSDSRGNRIEMSSRTAVDAPFFNIVLKVRYGRATHYKKYPVFLDLPQTAQPVKRATPLPTVSVGAMEKPAAATVSPVTSMTAEEMQAAEPKTEEVVSSFTPFDGWARTSHYGPMVYGDTISTVAERLRIDDRYTRNQVMVAIFEKNRSKFDQDNINLIQAGTHLDIPMAAEVERIRPAQAREIMQDHNRRWKELVKQPRYAAVEEAQRTRYSKRVRTGKSAAGVAAAPVSGQQEEAAGMAEPGKGAAEPEAMTEGAGSVDGAISGEEAAKSAALAETVAKLQQENEALQTKLAESDAKLAELSAAGKADAQVAAEARVKKLELQLARLQSELDTAKQSATAGEGPDWLMLLGGGLVLLLLGGGAGYLMRRERAHPAMEYAGGVAAPEAYEEMPVAPAAPEEIAEEIEVEPVEEFSPDATAKMDTDEFEGAFTDSIPDLTDEETGEMEAFKEDLEEEPDPNVDYLSEADVYMRYGMEDEAEKQVEMALKLRTDNKDAHVKLVQIRKAKGDEGGADEAIATARMSLAGDSLSNFESTIANLSPAETAVEEVSLEDTIPPGALDLSADEKAQESIEDATDLSGLGDIEFGEVEEPVPAPGAETEAATLDMGDMEFPLLEESHEESATEPASEVEETVVEEPGEAAAETPADTGGLDFDLSGLELPDSGEAVSEPAVEEAGEEDKVADDSSLNLSDMDISSEMAGEAPAAPEEELMTADLDKTVVMDWSKETVTSGDHDVGGESGASEAMITFDLEELEPENEPVAEPAPQESEDVEEAAPEESEPVAEPAPQESEPVAEAAPEESEPEEHLSSVEFDLEDLSIDLEEPVRSDDSDDFSSTIQTSTAEIEAEAAAKGVEKSDTVDLDAGVEIDESDASLGLEIPDEDTLSRPEEQSSAFEVDNASLEDLIEKSADKDFDATLELDSLLSELGEDDEDAAASPDDDSK